MAKYLPEPVPFTDDPAYLREYLGREFANVSTAFEGVENVELAELAEEPARPRDGMLKYADGTNWDPGSGEGFYGYRAGAWRALEAAAATVPDPLTIGTLRLTATGDVTLASTSHAFQIGPDSGLNLVVDQNEIQTRSNGAAGTLNLNIEGGNVSIGNSSSVINTNGALAVGATSTLSGNLNVQNAIALGDSDTGFRQNGDGILEVYANNQLQATINSSGTTINDALTVTGLVTSTGTGLNGGFKAGNPTGGRDYRFIQKDDGTLNITDETAGAVRVMFATSGTMTVNPQTVFSNSTGPTVTIANSSGGSGNTWGGRLLHLENFAPAIWMQDNTTSTYNALLSVDSSHFRIYGSDVTDGSVLNEHYGMNLTTGGVIQNGTTSSVSDCLLELRDNRTTTTSEGNAVFSIRRQNSATDCLVLGNDANNAALIGANNSTLRLGTWLSGVFTEHANITTAGVVNLTTGQLAFPATENLSSDANTLDDYEEGSFTPAITFGGGSTGVTYSAQSGFYVKIGTLIWARARITLTNKGTSTGIIKITGFPFTSANWYSAFVGFGSNWTGLTGCLMMHIESGTSQLSVRQSAAGGSSGSLTDTSVTNTMDLMVSVAYTN